MYKILDLYDGMEFSLSAVLGLIASGDAYSLYTHDNWRNYYLGWETTGKAAQSDFAKKYPQAYRRGYPDYYLVRPSVNSYAYANLKPLAQLYGLFSQKNNGFYNDKSAHYQHRAQQVQQQTLDVLWNEEDQFFNTWSAGDNAYGKGDFEARVRESVGYTPWYFNLIPPEENARYETAWKWFSSTSGFYNERGMTTAERQHPYYNEQAYAWNGRGWPFQNSVVYKAYANYLRHYKPEVLETDRELLYDYIDKLVQMHGSKQLNIGEWYIPSDGREFGGEKDYLASTFPDIVIEDLLGFKACHEEKFSINPLLPKEQWSYFYLGNMNYHGRTIDIIWKKDWDHKKTGDQSMLCVWVDGILKAQSEDLNAELVVDLPERK